MRLPWSSARVWAFIVTPGNDEPKFAPVAGGSRGPRAATRVSDRGRLPTTRDAAVDAVAASPEKRKLKIQKRAEDEAARQRSEAGKAKKGSKKKVRKQLKIVMKK